MMKNEMVRGIKLLALLLALCCVWTVLVACDKGDTEEQENETVQGEPATSEAEQKASDGASSEALKIETVTLPQTPFSIKKRTYLEWDERHYMETFEQVVDVAELTYKIEGKNLILTFSGKHRIVASSAFDWVLYDQDGNAVKDGSFSPVEGKTRKSFEDVTLTIEDVIETGKTYRFGIPDVGE